MIELGQPENRISSQLHSSPFLEPETEAKSLLSLQAGEPAWDVGLATAWDVGLCVRRFSILICQLRAVTATYGAKGGSRADVTGCWVQPHAPCMSA